MWGPPPAVLPEWRASLLSVRSGAAAAPGRPPVSTIGGKAGIRPTVRRDGALWVTARAGENLSSTEERQPSGFRGWAEAVWQHMQAFRERVEARPTLRRVYRIVIAVVGGIVLAAGIVLIPYPGPGWAVVFIGLAILASEFTWARRVLTFARHKYDAWTDWLGRQSFLVRLAVLAGTGLVVLATLWLLNVFYAVADWAGLGSWTWLQSPLFG